METVIDIIGYTFLLSMAVGLVGVMVFIFTQINGDDDD